MVLYLLSTVLYPSRHWNILRSTWAALRMKVIYMYIFPASRCPCPIYMGECSFYLSHRSHYQPTSSYASRFWFSRRLKLFNLHCSAKKQIIVMTINHIAPTYLCSTYQASIMEALLLAFMKPMRPPMKIIAANLGSQDSTGNHWS